MLEKVIGILPAEKLTEKMIEKLMARKPGPPEK
jgi:hypothetical protein